MASVSSTILYGAVASLFQPLGLPPATLVFTLITWTFVLSGNASPGLHSVILEALSLPEDHLKRVILSNSVMKEFLPWIQGIMSIDIAAQEGIHVLEKHLLPLLMNTAAARNDIDLLQHFIGLGASISSGDCGGRTPLHIAAAHGCTDTIEYLLSLDECNVSLLDSNGLPALDDAVTSNLSSIATMLLNAGANLTHHKYHHILLNYLASTDDPRIRLYVNCGADPNSQDELQRTPLHIAASNGLVSLSHFLVSNGACPLLEDQFKDTPFMNAKEFGHEGVVDVLSIKHDRASHSQEGMPLQSMRIVSSASAPDHLESVPYSDFYMDVGQVQDIMLAPLMCYGANVGDVTLLEALVDRFQLKTLVGIRDYDYRTPLHIACTNGQAGAVSFVLRMGSDTMAIDRWGKSALLDALLNRHHSTSDTILRELKLYGAKLSYNSGNPKRGMRIIHELRKAILSDNLWLIRRILSHCETGHLIDSQDYDGRTPLHLALGHSRDRTVTTILLLGPCLTIPDRWGRNAYNEAERLGRISLIKEVV